MFIRKGVRSNQTSRVRRWLASFTVLALVAGVGVMPGASVMAAEPTDMVLEWNLHAVNALSNPLSTAVPPPPVPGAGQPPPVASLHLAMVQGAVYDAVNAIDGGHEPYLDGLPPAPESASKAAAAGTAAHHVLVGLVPALPQVVRDRLDTLYTASLAEITDSQAKTDGINIGAAVATAMLGERADDGRYVPHSFPVGSLPGEWRPTLPGFVNDPFAWVARVRPFTLTSTSQFRTEGPLDLTSAEYAAEFNEVKALGAATGSARTEEQTLLARFYSANPLPFMHRAFREIAEDRGLSPTEDARLFVMLSMSSADALINCWDDKDYWSFWRPITAIREAADDGNPATSPQADWLPFFPTPPYPDHPSGYNCFTSAMMHTAKAYFRGDQIAIELTSPGTNTTLIYKRFTAVVKDTIDGRIYNGFHFRTPDVQGAWIGKKVAQWIDKHYFEAVD